MPHSLAALRLYGTGSLPLLPFLAHASLSWPRCPGARDGAAAGAAAALDSRHGPAVGEPRAPPGAASPPVMPIGMYGQPVYYAPPIAYAPMYAASAPPAPGGGSPPTGYSQQPYASGSPPPGYSPRSVAEWQRYYAKPQQPYPYYGAYASPPYSQTRRRRPRRRSTRPPTRRCRPCRPKSHRRRRPESGTAIRRPISRARAPSASKVQLQISLRRQPTIPSSTSRTRAGARRSGRRRRSATCRPSSRRAGRRGSASSPAPTTACFPRRRTRPTITSPWRKATMRCRRRCSSASKPWTRPRRASARSRRMLSRPPRRARERSRRQARRRRPRRPHNRGPSGPARAAASGVGGGAGAGGARNGASGEIFFSPRQA